jgi:spermidine synthase/MFS family permease
LKLHRWSAYLVVFTAGACTLALEIVAGRILAPYVGVSLYTWTSIIGVVLAGVSLGNYAGGRIADRWTAARTLGFVLLIGGLASLLVLPLTQLAADRSLFRTECGPNLGGWLGGLCTPQLVTMARILLLASAIFFLPAFILGTVAPIVIRLSLGTLETSGAIVGRLYAASNFGSILGAFLTGFWLISGFGTRQVVLGIGVLLAVMGVASGKLWRGRGTSRALALVAAAALMILLVSLVDQRRALDSGCYRETDYFCIKVYDQPHERDRVLRTLALDHLVHSYNALDDPTYYEYSYIRVYAEVADYVAGQRPDFRALFIGGGGYTLSRGLEVEYSNASLEVVEIDPGVTRTAYELMGLPPQTRIATHNLDARLALAQLQPTPRYHLVFGDAFNDLSVPYHLTTLEFDERVRAVLDDDGFYLINVIDKFRGGLFLPSVVRTMRAVFPYVYLMSAGAPWKSMASSPSTYVVAGTARPIDQDRLNRVQPQGAGGTILTSIMPLQEMEEWLEGAGGFVLTDDFAPADNLLAPLFAERGL